MDRMWLDRDRADETVEGVDFRDLKYDPDTGLYTLADAPFSGVRKTRWPDGTLRGLSHFKGGVASGVSVSWHANGRVKSYSEMEDDVYHGWHLEWAEDGITRVEAHYTEGCLDEVKGE